MHKRERDGGDPEITLVSRTASMESNYWTERIEPTPWDRQASNKDASNESTQLNCRPAGGMLGAPIAAACRYCEDSTRLTLPTRTSTHIWRSVHTHTLALLPTVHRRQLTAQGKYTRNTDTQSHGRIDTRTHIHTHTHTHTQAQTRRASLHAEPAYS